MKSICIKTNNSNLLDYLYNEFKQVDSDNICFSINEFKKFKNIIIHYNGNDLPSFIKKISSILSYLVIDEFEEDLLKKIIFKNYFYFDNKEKEQILNICFDIFSDDFTNQFDKKFNILLKAFSKYLRNNKVLFLDGFINFRLPNYNKLLESTVDDAVNSFIVEKEYLEFVSLLKLYISTQASQIDIIHLIYSDENSILLDNNKNIIPFSEDLLKTKYLSDISFSKNDYILNTLLNLIPKKIYIHLVNNYVDDFINTISIIFENRIEFCNDCNICKLYKNIPNHKEHIKKLNLINKNNISLS